MYLVDTTEVTRMNSLQSPPTTTAASPDFLPPQLKVLFITGRQRTGRWLADALAGDSASEVALDEVTGVTAGLARLRDEVFDAVLVSHEPHDLDALDLLEVLRTGSSESQPIVVLGSQSEQEMAALCYEEGADAYICVNTTTTRTLLWQVARAVQRHQVLEENRQLRQSQQQQLKREQDEAKKLLRQQRALLNGSDDGDDDELPPPLPSRLVEHYRELLKAYIIMGSGNLREEMHHLVDLLVVSGATAREAMRLHLAALEEVIAGLGNRSARHVMNRADLLGLEVVMLLAEQYRDRYLERVQPQRQLSLPGFES